MTVISHLLPKEILDPSGKRTNKPRNIGITMIMDKGLGIQQFDDFLQIASSYIDYIKLGFGTSVLYPKPLLQKKIELAQRYNVKIYPGGTLAEVAISQQSFPAYLKYLKGSGITTVEISDGTIEIDEGIRHKWIVTALDQGFEVITEFGKKADGSKIHIEQLKEQVYKDLSLGVSYVIVEGRESGTNVGVYDATGALQDDAVQVSTWNTELLERIIWEAPLKKQQTALIKFLGCNVNLGNIPYNEVIALEALRRGLRSDTFIGEKLLI